MSLRVHCDICFHSHPLESVRVLPICGHGFCISCLDTHAAMKLHQGIRRPPCPVCRKSFNPAKAIQVFLQPPSDVGSSSQPSSGPMIEEKPRLEYSEGVKRQARHVSERIGQINERSAVDTVKRMGKEVRKVVDAMESDRKGDDVVQTLLNALASFTDRVTPIFAQTTELCNLRQKLNTRNSQVTSLQQQLTTLKNDLKHQEGLLTEAVDTTERANNRYHTEKAKNVDMLLNLAKSRNEAEEKGKEVDEYKRIIIAHKQKAERQSQKKVELNARLREYENEIEDLRAQLDRQGSAISMSSQDQHSETDNTLNDEDLDGILNFIENSPEPTCSYLKPSHAPSPTHRQAVVGPTRPKFASDWNLDLHPTKKRRVSNPDDPNAVHFNETLGLNREGKPVKGSIQLGTRRSHRLFKDNM